MNIVFIGAGNLAYHLAKALKKGNCNILQVYSRTFESAITLAKCVGAEAVNDFKSIVKTADLYIIAVSDNAIFRVIESLQIENKNVVHTAGSIDMEVLSRAKNYGVFYPLQTFSKNTELDFSKIPMCIEADNDRFKSILITLAKQITNNIWEIDSEKREQLHLAAVFVCNFVNHMYSLASEIMEIKNIDFEIFHSLMQETVNKAIKNSPKEVQTGPAKRNDKNTIKKHLDLLSSQPNLKVVYEAISNSIQKTHNNK